VIIRGLGVLSIPRGGLQERACTVCQRQFMPVTRNQAYCGSLACDAEKRRIQSAKAYQKAKRRAA
jgi:hypothetical protein